MKKMFDIPFDQFQRYEICSRLIQAYSKNQQMRILDIGGFFIGPSGKPLLPAVEFLKTHDVLVIDTIDVETPNYMKSDGRNLPFADASFDFVISNDVLEHVHPHDRKQFIGELIRVAKKYVIINNPYYTAKTALAEKILYEYLVNVLDTEHEMLSEHLKYGLPEIDVISKYLDDANAKYTYYFSGDIDNWLYLMILRHELMSKKAGHLVNYLDSYFNEHHFETEMNLHQGYRSTLIIATSEDNTLLENNFFNEIGTRTATKVQMPFSSIIDLFRLKSENEQKSVYDLMHSNFNSITPRMSLGNQITQTFTCSSANLYKIGLLVATFTEKLQGYLKINLLDLENDSAVVEKVISLIDFKDNEWFYIDFPPLFDSNNKNYMLKIEQISNTPGCAFYISNDSQYGQLMFNDNLIDGNLSIRLQIRETNQPEKYVLLSQEKRDLQKYNMLLENKLSEAERQVQFLNNLLEQKNNNIELLQNDLIQKEHYFKNIHEYIEDLKENANRIKETFSEQFNKLEIKSNSNDHRIQELNNQIQTLNQKVSEQENIVLHKDQELQTIYATISWKITKPLRWMTRKKRAFVRLCRAYSRFTYKNGGLLKGSFKAPDKVLKIIKRHGVKGFIRKLKEHSNAHSIQPVMIPLKEVKFDTNKFVVNSIEEYSLLQPHIKTVDIIVCVHNALDDVKRCLESVIQYTKPPYNLILVDDGSKEEAAAYLRHFSETQNAILIRNDEARGYTLAANQGLRKSTSDYALLLNSDTIVTSMWIDRMIACAESDEKIGMVGPLSNTASWQSIPELLVNGDWADNDLPENITVKDMAGYVAANSQRVYPQIDFLNGFCLMIKRSVIEQIGIFDEETFARGYGEENDYCIRVKKAGYRLAVADDAYVFHAQSKSYSHEKRKVLAQQADAALAAKHGQAAISQGVEVCRYDRVMEGIRARSASMLDKLNLIKEGLERYEGLRVLFILPILDAGGGGNVVIQEAEAMLDMGVDVRILNLAEHKLHFQKSYERDHFRVPVIYINDVNEIDNVASNFDAVIATAFHTVEWMKDCSSNGQPIRAYYIQDFEPYFFEKGTLNYEKAWKSYDLYPDLIRVTKTEWNQREVKKQIGVNSYLVGPSVNTELFRPRRRRDHDWPNRPLRIAAMVRPSTPRRNPALTMEILKEATLKHGSNIEIIIFGCNSDDPDFLNLELDFQWKNAGVLTRRELAWLLNEVDIFVDYSSFQAMGLTAMEAMACGAAVIVPKQGGASSFLKHNENGIIVDTSSKDACINALNKLILDQDLRSRLQRQATYDICKFSTENAAFKLLDSMFGRRIR